MVFCLPIELVTRRCAKLLCLIVNMFYYRKGDYYRYMSEFIPSNSEICDKSLTAYKTACDIAMGEDGLGVTHPIRLGLVLNFSVFFYEILGDRNKAIVLARDAFDKAVKVVDVVPKDWQKDATLIMQLLSDNITVWTTESQGTYYYIYCMCIYTR